MATAILIFILCYGLYLLVSLFILGFIDCNCDISFDEEERFLPYIFLGVLYTIYRLIAMKIKNKNKEELKRKQEEIERLNDCVYDLICYDNDIFRDVKNKYKFIFCIEHKEYSEYEDLENKRQRIIDKCYSILYRIIKINRYADGYEDEFIKAINDTYDALKEIDNEYKDRENKVEEKLKKINKEKLKQELEELNQLKKNEIEYFKYGNGEM